MARPVLFNRIRLGYYAPANGVGLLVMIAIMGCWPLLSYLYRFLTNDYSDIPPLIIMVGVLIFLQIVMFLFGD